MSTTPLLSGVRIIESSLLGPGQISTFFSDLGADVIKVESVLKGDAMRHRGGTNNEGNLIGMSTPYLTQASGKRSIAIDINTKSGYPPRVVEIFNDWGFAWGGTWTSPDEMHFELRDLSASVSKTSS